MMLAASASAGPAGDVLRGHGLTPAAIDASLRRLLRADDDGLDADALADLGIDLDAVRTRVEATFGPGALAPAKPARRAPEPIPPTRQVPRTPAAHPARDHLPAVSRPAKPTATGTSPAPVSSTSLSP